MTAAVPDPRFRDQLAEVQRCGACGGCPLPVGHNRGRVDIPENHAAPAAGAHGQLRERIAATINTRYGALEPPFCAEGEDLADALLSGPLAPLLEAVDFACWVVSLDDDDPESPGRIARRTVTLNEIVTRAGRALDPS